jgi:diacylglycerol kinase (ATP)
VLEDLVRLNVSFEVQETTAPGDAERFAREADPARVDVVVAAGGDGTVNEVINGLAASGLPLGLVPLGTANVLAAEIGQDLEPRAVAATLAQGDIRRIALGSANGRRFIVMAGAGFDAHVVREVSVPLKRRLGKGAYVLASIDQLIRFDFKPYRVRVNGSAYDAASVVVANGRFYAGRYLCAPAAALDQPSLEVCLFERGGRLPAIGYAAALLADRLPELKSFKTIRTDRVTIEGRDGEPVQGDGDVLTRLDVEIEVVPDALRLIVPPITVIRPPLRGHTHSVGPRAEDPS